MRPFEPLEYEELSPRLRSTFPEDAGMGLKMAAANGNLPLVTEDLVTCLYFLAADEEIGVRRSARRSLRKLPENILKTALNARLSPKILNWFAHVELDTPEHYERILLNRETADETFVYLAGTRKEERAIEIIARNEQRLTRAPEIIEALQNNPNAPISVVERACEFFRYQTGRSHIEVLDEQRSVAASEPAEEAAAEEAPPEKEVEGAIPGEEGAEPMTPPEEVPAELPEDERAFIAQELPPKFSADDLESEDFDAEDIFTEEFLLDAEAELDADTRESLANRIRRMPVINKMRLALKGNMEARGILIKSPNKMIQECVLKNPRITGEEIVKLVKDKSQREELIRIITGNREWTKNYVIIFALCWNPKTPPARATKYLNRLNVKDLQSISRSKQVPGMLAVQARKLVEIKERYR